MSYLYLGQTRPKGRKQYTCVFCKCPILEGEVHIKRIGVIDGDFDSVRMHLECEEVTQAWDEDDWEHQDPWEFRKELEEFRARTNKY